MIIEKKGDKAQLEIANFSLFQKLIEFHMRAEGWTEREEDEISDF